MTTTTIGTCVTCKGALEPSQYGGYLHADDANDSHTPALFATHPKTGLPVQTAPTFEVGDLVTEHILSDGYPAVVVHATAKTVYVRRVDWVGNFRSDDAPGYNGYGDSGTIAVDPESVAEAISRGKGGGANKYVLHVSAHPTTSYSMAEQEVYGEAGFHRARWRMPGGSMYLTAGAKYRQDPHV